MPGDFKGTLLQKKSNGGVKYWPMRNNIQIFFVGYLKKFLCIWRIRITAKNEGKLSTSIKWKMEFF
jgi:hypothetical protein